MTFAQWFNSLPWWAKVLLGLALAAGATGVVYTGMRLIRIGAFKDENELKRISERIVNEKDAVKRERMLAEMRQRVATAEAAHRAKMTTPPPAPEQKKDDQSQAQAA